MLNKKIIATANAPAAIGPYSQAILVDLPDGQAGGWLFVSGQIPIEPTSNKIIDGDIAGQTGQVLNNIKAVVEAAGGTMQNIVKATIYLKDMADFPKVNEVYKQYFPKDPPARATVQVSRLPKDVSIEIDAIAFIKGV